MARFSARHRALVAAALLVAAWIGVAFLRYHGRDRSERRAILDMPAVDRSALFLDLLRSAETLCARATVERALEDRCSSAADFLTTFPECGADCRRFAEAHHHGHGPSR